MFRALTANLVLHERIETTEAKAKELRRIAERLVSRARRLGPIAYTPWEQLSEADRSRRLAAKRQVASYLRRIGTTEVDGNKQTVDLVEKVFVDLARRFEGRPGGYTRIVKLGARRGDNAPMTYIEWVVGSEGEAAPEAEAPAAEASAAAGE